MGRGGGGRGGACPQLYANGRPAPRCRPPAPLPSLCPLLPPPPPPPLCAGSAQLYANARHKGGRGGLGGAERVPPACLPRGTGRGGEGEEKGGEGTWGGGRGPRRLLAAPPPRRHLRGRGTKGRGAGARRRGAGAALTGGGPASRSATPAARRARPRAPSEPRAGKERARPAPGAAPAHTKGHACRGRAGRVPAAGLRCRRPARRRR